SRRSRSRSARLHNVAARTTGRVSSGLYSGSEPDHGATSRNVRTCPALLLAGQRGFRVGARRSVRTSGRPVTPAVAGSSPVAPAENDSRVGASTASTGRGSELRRSPAEADSRGDRRRGARRNRGRAARVVAGPRWLALGTCGGLGGLAGGGRGNPAGSGDQRR